MSDAWVPIKDRVTAEITEAMTAASVGIQNASPEQLALLAFRVFRDQEIQASLVEDIAEWLDLLDQAWDAPVDKSTSGWQRERALVAMSVLLTRLGHGTPTMRGELCGVVLSDGSTCVYGRHHVARNHRSGSSHEEIG